MSSLRVVAFVLGQFAFGLAALSLLGEAALRCMPRLEKLASALLVGLVAPTYFVLLLLFAGLPLSGWWWTSFGLAGVAGLLFRPKALRALLASPPPIAPPPWEGLRPLGIMLAAALLALFAWAFLAAFYLPTTDFDGLAIWSFRVRVLLAERTFYTPTFLDPTRFTPMPRHPYFLPVLESSYALAYGSFHYALIHLPLLLCYAAYLGLAWAAAKSFQSLSWRSVAFACSLLLLPAMAVNPSVEGAREPFIGMLGFAALWYLVRWSEEPRSGWLFLGGVFALAAQQTKIEGLPLALGFAAAAFLITLSSDSSRLLRLRQTAFTALLMLLLALPWYYVRKRLLPSTHDYAFSSGFGSNLAQRIQALPQVGYLLMSELFLRPELYGLAPLAALVALLSGWKRRNAFQRLAVLIPPALCLAGILAIYAVRQGQMGPERNVSFSRRMVCMLPSLILASFYLPGCLLHSKGQALSKVE